MSILNKLPKITAEVEGLAKIVLEKHNKILNQNKYNLEFSPIKINLVGKYSKFVACQILDVEKAQLNVVFDQKSNLKKFKTYDLNLIMKEYNFY